MNGISRDEREETAKPASGTIIFGTQRLEVIRNGSRRLFVPVQNMISTAVQSAAGNPRAILRMVAGYC